MLYIQSVSFLGILTRSFPPGANFKLGTNAPAFHQGVQMSLLSWRSPESWTREIIAGFTVFLAMAYVLFINPVILSGAGVPNNAVFIATCVSAGLGCLLVGLLADFPISVAPGMALNTYFALILVQKLGYSWETALAASLLAAALFIVVVISGLSGYLIKAIPHCLHLGIIVGLGILLTLLGLKYISAIHITAGQFHLGSLNPKIVFAGIALVVIALLDKVRVPAALILGIIITALLGHYFLDAPYYGVISLPPKPQIFFHVMNFKALFTFKGVSIIFSLFLVLFLDCAGTFVGLLSLAKLPVEKKRLTKGLFSASLVSLIGSLFGTSGVSAYAESAAGIRAGGHTGITAIVVGILFILALFFSPLVRSIPIYATAPALIYVGFMMLKSIMHFDWKQPVLYLPSLITAILIPYTFSIANGVAAGTISFLLLALITKNKQLITKPLVMMTGIFVLYFLTLLIRVL